MIVDDPIALDFVVSPTFAAVAPRPPAARPPDPYFLARKPSENKD
jgi:hypothetical protein